MLELLLQLLLKLLMLKLLLLKLLLLKLLLLELLKLKLLKLKLMTKPTAVAEPTAQPTPARVCVCAQEFGYTSCTAVSTIRNRDGVS